MVVSFSSIVKTFVSSRSPCNEFAEDPQRMTEKALLQKLRSLGVHLNKGLLRQLGRNVISVQQIAGFVSAELPAKDKQEAGVIYICMAELWRRWFPDALVYEFLANRVYSVYDLLSHDNVSAAARVWYKTWPHFARFFDKLEVSSASDFRKQFPSFDELLYWISDIANQLTVEGGEYHFLDKRISFCEEVLARLYSDGNRDDTAGIIREVLVRSYVFAGDLPKAEELLQRWLEADPGWSTGWLCWACCYSGIWGDTEDCQRAERLLRNGLSVLEQNEKQFCPKIQEDRIELLQHLVAILEEQERFSEVKELEDELNQLARSCHKANELLVDLDGPPTKEDYLVALSIMNKHMKGPKIAHKDPCPCGSGIKFKNCCAGD